MGGFPISHIQFMITFEFDVMSECNQFNEENNRMHFINRTPLNLNSNNLEQQEIFY